VISTPALACAALLLVAFPASAATYNLTPVGGNGSTSSSSMTLSALIADVDAVVVVGDLLFYGFNYSALGDIAGANGVSMLGYRDSAGNLGARFQASFIDSPGGTPSAGELNYSVSLQSSLADSGWRITDAKLAMAGASVGDGSSLAVSGSFAQRDDLLTVQATKLDANPPVIASSDQETLDPPAAELLTSTEIFLSAGSAASSSASLSNFSQTFVWQQVGNLDPLPGDFNDDRVVNGEDLLTWHGSFDVDDGGDTNGDLLTDGTDFLYWQRYVGSSTPEFAVAAVPEPASLGGAAVAWAALLGARFVVSRRAAGVDRAIR
jgi:hypothetical protein